MEFRPEFINKTEMEFSDISSEQTREYTFCDADVTHYVIIDQPYMLHVSQSGGHRIFDMSGVCHYIPSGWVHLSWTTREGQPHFVV